MGVWHHLQGVQSFSLRPFCYQGEYSTKLALSMSFIPDPMAWKEDAFQHSWGCPSFCAFSPFTFLRWALWRIMLSQNLTIIPDTPLWSQKEWFADFLTLLVEVPLELLLLWNLLVQPHVRMFHRDWGRWIFTLGNCQMIHMQGIFSKEVADVTCSDPRESTAYLYQGRWSRFLYLCHPVVISSNNLDTQRQGRNLCLEWFFFFFFFFFFCGKYLENKMWLYRAE